MTDCFALLDLPRLPWLEPETVKTRFLERSTQCHPDTLGDVSEAERQAAAARYANLNAAHQTLREPKTRIAHLLHLTTGSAPTALQTVSNAAANTFFEVSQLCRQTDAFLATRAKATSPLLKATLFAQGLDWTDRIQTLQQSLAARRTALEQELAGLNASWEQAFPSQPAPTEAPAAVNAPLLRQLDELYQQLGYLGRWNAQLEERLVQLAT